MSDIVSLFFLHWLVHVHGTEKHIQLEWRPTEQVWNASPLEPGVSRGTGIGCCQLWSWRTRCWGEQPTASVFKLKICILVDTICRLRRRSMRCIIVFLQGLVNLRQKRKPNYEFGVDPFSLLNGLFLQRRTTYNLQFLALVQHTTSTSHIKNLTSYQVEEKSTENVEWDSHVRPTCFFVFYAKLKWFEFFMSHFYPGAASSKSTVVSRISAHKTTPPNS